MKKVSISGSVFALDPIRNIDAYARATFSDTRFIEYSYGANDKEITFSIIKDQTVSSLTTIEELTEGIIKGTDENVVWNVRFQTVRHLTAVA